jgi:hypothetical protein
VPLVTDIPEVLWKDEDAAKFLRITVESFQNLMRRVDAPPSYKPTGRGPRSRRYFIPEEVMAWVREHPSGESEAVA